MNHFDPGYPQEDENDEEMEFSLGETHELFSEEIEA